MNAILHVEDFRTGRFGEHDDTATIQRAIDKSRAGDTILFESHYFESWGDWLFGKKFLKKYRWRNVPRVYKLSSPAPRTAACSIWKGNQTITGGSFLLLNTSAERTAMFGLNHHGDGLSVIRNIFTIESPSRRGFALHIPCGKDKEIA